MDWTVFNKLTGLARAHLRKVTEERLELLARWNMALSAFHGDPSRRDWSRFRPLRLSREEDWSDWLAYLIETSGTGRITSNLVGGFLEAGYLLGKCQVHREVPTIDGERRGDLVIAWESGTVVHVEVKIGDRNFGKTLETGMKLRSRFPQTRVWKDLILVPAEDLDEWMDAKKNRDVDDDDDDDLPTETVDEITWDDVALAIRKSLAAGGEDPLWMALAYAFTGAVEQRILRHPVSTPEADTGATDQLRLLDSLAKQADLLRKGLEHDR